MNQSISEELDELIQDVIDAEKSWGYGDPEDLDNAKADLKDFIQSKVSKAIAERDRKLREFAEDHYWGSLQEEKETILKHLDYIFSLIEEK